MRPSISPKVNASAHSQALIGCTLKYFGDFPDGPVVKTLCFHCREHRFDLWSGLSTEKLMLLNCGVGEDS